MKKKPILAICLCFFTVISFGQSGNSDGEFNFGFETKTLNAKLPDNWFVWGSGYSLTIDTIVRKSGNASVLIKPIGQKTANSFGCIAYGIPADYVGKEIELRASMKYTNVTDGTIGLLLRIDGEAGPLEFDNMQQKNVKGTSDWTDFSVKLSYPEEANMIYIGGLLSGKGQLWVDDFELFIDGVEIQYAKQKVKEPFKADDDKEFDEGSGIKDIFLTEKVIADLTTLGKLWGFLKYYHPAVAKGDYNWDYELFRILPQVLAAKDLNERNTVLLSWVTHLGEFKRKEEDTMGTYEIKLSPDLSWIDHSDFGDALDAKLKDIIQAERKEKHYYIGLAPSVGNPVFKNERPYTDMKYPDAGFRLLSLYRYWNSIEYYFPYKNLIEEDWDDVLKEFVSGFVAAANELDYKLAVLALIARVHDTHANIWGQDNILQDFRGIHYAPVEVKFIENKAVVTGYMDDALGQASGLKTGDIIERVNHTTVEEMVDVKLPITPASNYPTQLRDIARDLLRTNDSIILLDCRRDDSTFTVRVSCVTYKSMNLSTKLQQKDTCFKMITPDIAWLYPGNIKMDYLPVIMPEIMKTKGLIIDFRCYPSDFIVFYLSEYLLPKPTSFVKFSIGSITSPGLFMMNEPLEVGKLTDDHYKGKVVIIVNEVTQSSAEYHTMAFRTVPGALVIGSTTAGADGNVSPFFLPGGIRTMISGIGVYYPDGTETQRVGIIPDVEVKPTIKGIEQGRDEVLERAIEIIKAH